MHHTLSCLYVDQRCVQDAYFLTRDCTHSYIFRVGRVEDRKISSDYMGGIRPDDARHGSHDNAGLYIKPACISHLRALVVMFTQFIAPNKRFSLSSQPSE